MRDVQARIVTTASARSERKSLPRKLVRIGRTLMLRGDVASDSRRNQRWTFVIYCATCPAVPARVSRIASFYAPFRI